jgi:hypothetical protein
MFLSFVSLFYYDICSERWTILNVKCTRKSYPLNGDYREQVYRVKKDIPKITCMYDLRGKVNIGILSVDGKKFRAPVYIEK